jgi:DNA recombination protein RmuC
MQGATEEAVRTAKLTEHARATRAHVRALADKKYWTQFPESPDFVVMFVPGESFLADALRAESSLMDEAMRSRVVITSPMSLMALLLTVARGWQTRQMAESATQIATEAAELYKRMGVVLGHVDKTGRHIDSAANAYNELVGSMERRVMPALRRFTDLGVPGETHVEPRVIDHAIRAVNLPETPAGELEA